MKNFPYVDLVFGTHNIHKLPQYLRDAYFSQDRVIEVYSQEGDIVEEIPMNASIKLKHGLILCMDVMSFVHIVSFHILEGKNVQDVLKI